MEIATVAAATSQDHLVVLLGVRFWRSVLLRAVQNYPAIFAFYNDPRSAGRNIKAGYNLVEVSLSSGSKAILQLSYLPHTMHWAEVLSGEGTSVYRARIADTVASKADLSVTAEDFLSAMKEIDAAFDGHLNFDLDPAHWDQPRSDLTSSQTASSRSS